MKNIVAHHHHHHPNEYLGGRMSVYVQQMT